MENLVIKGTCKWAKVRTPDSYNGQEIGYTMSLYPSKEDLKKYENAAEEALDKAKQEDWVGKKFGKAVNIGVREEDNGDTFIRLKAKSTYIDKDTKQEVRKKLPIFNIYGQIIPEDVLIGNGSEVEVSIALVPYHFSSSNYGVTPRMRAIKVNNLVEYGGDYGFEYEEEEENKSDF